MTTVEVSQKNIATTGITIIQGEKKADTFCFHFNNPDSELTTDLTYQRIYKNQVKEATVTLTRKETSDGFNLVWEPDDEVSATAGRFSFMIVAFASDKSYAWKSATASICILPALNS